MIYYGTFIKPTNMTAKEASRILVNKYLGECGYADLIYLKDDIQDYLMVDDNWTEIDVEETSSLTELSPIVTDSVFRAIIGELKKDGIETEVLCGLYVPSNNVMVGR